MARQKKRRKKKKKRKKRQRDHVAFTGLNSPLVCQTHVLCRRCGNHSYHLQKSRCARCAYPAPKIRSFNWGYKAIRRRTTGTGRMRYLKNVPRRFKNGFREGTVALPKNKGEAAK